MPVPRFPVEEGAILMFARAIGDPNPIYSDRELAAESEIGAQVFRVLRSPRLDA